MKKFFFLAGTLVVVLMSAASYANAFTDCGHSDACGKDSDLMGMTMAGAMEGHGDKGNMAGMHDEKGSMPGQEMKNAGQGHGGHSEMTQWQGMSRHMIPMMKSMEGMTHDIKKTMETKMAPEDMKEVSGLMGEMSKQMSVMAEMMQRGSASEGEMHSLHQQINATESAVRQLHAK